MAKAPRKVQASAEEKALGESSIGMWNDYVSRFRPAEAALAKDAILTPGERASIKGGVSGDVGEAFKGLTRSTISSGEISGADVNSGKTKLSLAGDAEARGKATGIGQNVADVTAGLDEEQKKLQIVGFGRDIQTDTTRFAARGAQRATSVAIAASNASFQRNQARTDAVAGIAGAAFRRFAFDEEGNRKFGKKKDPFSGDLEPVDIDPFSTGSSSTLGFDAFKRAGGDPFAGIF